MSNVQYIPFNEAFLGVPVGKFKVQENNYLPKGDYKVVDQGKALVAGYTNEVEFVQSDVPYILFGDHTKVTKFIDFPFVVGADGVRLYKASQGFDPLYLFYFLTSLSLPSDGYGRHSKYLEDKLVPKIDIALQKEISEKIRNQFYEIEQARKAAKVQKQDLHSILAKQQKKALEILEELHRLPLEDYLEGIEAGKSIKTTELLAKKDELGVLKVSAVSWNKFQPDEAKSVIEGYDPPETHRVKKGDLIITRANTLELVGAVVLVGEDHPNRLLSDKTLRLKLKDGKVLPEYLLHILKLPEARKHIEENATGTSDSMRNISQKAILKIPIPQADEDQQKEIIELLQGVQTEAKKGELAVKSLLADLEILPAKLLKEAFNEIENE